MRTALYLLWQCTWGILQTLAGLGVFLANRHAPRSRFRGALVTRWDRPASLSLGPFLFVSAREDGEAARRVLIHEYGHSIQSLVLGPLYLPVIGLPSLIWCNAPPCRRRRLERGTDYSAFYPERWADSLGEKMTGERALRSPRSVPPVLDDRPKT